ncbi:MAG: GTP 3',8-cyclase MoaA [Thermoplasmata archaeon]|nr:MAG: GTP 3',8-cyclase MoaA [Thermoplasmata archaeon]
MSMLDRYGRQINNMRISVTQQCNLDCFYCHHEGEDGHFIGNGHMKPEEIGKIAEIASKVGIEKLKITGGEPLLRRDIIDIVGRTAKHMKEVSMTTNGVLLSEYADELRKAGLNRVNISFDAPEPNTFQRITKSDVFDDVRDGVCAAQNAGLTPVKLNMVVLKGINDHHIPQAIEFASKVGAILQLIEFESSCEGANSSFFKRYHFDLCEMEEELNNRACEVRQRNMQRRKKYILPSENNGTAEVEIVRGMHNSKFCENCTRLRVTSTGELKPCLLINDNHINIIDSIRNGAEDEELMNMFKKAILLKEPYWRA